MTPERWKCIREIFDSAAERGSDAEEFARVRCGQDAEMYAEVHRMLQEHRRSGFLDRTPDFVGEPAASQPVFAGGEVVAGRYRIVRYLDRGGMGEVYEAHDLELKERVALKTLLPAIAADQSMIARFKHEITLSRKIAHPNVCRVFDLVRHDVDSAAPILCLTMEFLPGETLADKLQREGRMNVEAALPLVEQMVMALEAAHSVGVIHRDFKPSNVMLVPVGSDSPGSRAVVTDFGLARRFVNAADSTDTLSMNVVGTLDYMAPELLTGSIATYNSDVYALGMVVYRMVTGTLPFSGSTPLAAAVMRSKARIPSPRIAIPDLDPKWELAILHALEADPQRRFSKASDFIQALRSEPVSVPIRLPGMNRRFWVAAGLAAVVAGTLWWRILGETGNRQSPEAEALYRKGVDDIHLGAYYAATNALTESVRLAPNFSLSHARLGEALLELDLPDKASLQMQLARRFDVSTLPRIAKLQIDAIDLAITRDFALAAAKYEQIAKLTGGNSPDLEFDLARAYERADRMEDAIALYRRAASRPDHNPAAWLRLAVRYSRSAKGPEDYVTTDKAFDNAEQSYRESSNLEGIAEVIFQRGVALSRRGQIDDSNGYLIKAVETARLVRNIHQEIRADLQLASNAYVSGDAAAVETYAREALELAKANRMENLAISGVINLGNASFRRGDTKTAEKYYREAQDMAGRNNSPRFIALSNLLLASLHDQLGQPQSVAKEAADAVAYFEPHHWAEETFSGLALLGRAKSSQGDYQGAFESFTKLLDAADKSQNRRQITIAREGLGYVLARQERYPEALAQYQEMLRQNAGPEKTGYAELHCGSIMSQLGNFEEAARLFSKADQETIRFPSLKPGIQEARAELANRRGDYAEAVRIARRLAEGAKGNLLAMARAESLLGISLLGEGNVSEARRYLEHSLLALSGGSSDPADCIMARLATAEARLDSGDRPGAISLLRDSEPLLRARPESRWRALVLMYRADKQYQSEARQALDQLRTAWGDTVFQTYFKRRDIQRQARPLSLSISAKR